MVYLRQPTTLLPLIPARRRLRQVGLPSVAHTDSDMKIFVPATYLDERNREYAEQLKTNVRTKPDATTPNSFGAVFTTSRVFPDVAIDSYPYLTAGKLFFYDPGQGGYYVCSAWVLRPRIVMTAGHCVTHPSTDPN